MDLPLDILFEDNHCLAVAKPAPLLTQGVPPGIPTLEVQVKNYLKERYRKPGNVYLGIPHRLDRPVSGVVLFARNTKAARRLAEQFQQHQVEKVYWALVDGKVQPEQGTWEDWLRKLPEEARTERLDAEEPGSRHAQLDYRCLQVGADGRCWRSGRGQAECIRSGCRRRRAAGRSGAIGSTGLDSRSALQPSCPATASLPCTAEV